MATELKEGMADMKVSDLMLPGLLIWDSCKVADLFNPRNGELTISIPLSHRAVVDEWAWLGEKSGCCTVKEGYKLLQSRMDIPSNVTDK